VTSYAYDGESRLTSLGASLGGTPITSFGYVLDAAGNRTRKTDPRLGRGLPLRRLYRLTSVDRSSGTPTRWRYAYDPVGNRTGEQVDDAPTGATFNNTNQLLAANPGVSSPSAARPASRPR